MGDDVKFLAALTADERAALEALGVVRRYARGTALFHQGDDAGGVLVLLRGRVKVASLGPEGKEVVLGFPGEGELLGELAAVDERPRAATVTAAEDVEALAVPGAAFRRFLEEHPRLALVLWRVATARLRDADVQRTDFAAYDVTGRVARRLVELADEAGDISLPLTQDELAAWTAASREAVSRALLTLRMLGWVETHRRRITVTNLDALRRYAG